MNFTLEEIEVIKDALLMAVSESYELLDNPDGVIRILDRIDEENELD